MEKACTVTPRWESAPFPATRKKIEIANPSTTARLTMPARSDSGSPFVSEVKMGNTPEGSTNTSRVVKRSARVALPGAVLVSRARPLGEQPLGESRRGRRPAPTSPAPDRVGVRPARRLQPDGFNPSRASPRAARGRLRRHRALRGDQTKGKLHRSPRCAAERICAAWSGRPRSLVPCRRA